MMTNFRRIFSVFLLTFATLSLAAQTPGVRIEFTTTMGNFTVVLFKETPEHAANFEKLVREGFYTNLLFHRTIRNFMVQGGDPDSRQAQPYQPLGEGGLPYTLPLELALPGIYHHRGALAAARLGDDENPERRSSSTQFYIVWGKTFAPSELSAVKHRLAETTGRTDIITPAMAADYEKRGGAPHLDGQYTVFGEVVEGLDVIGKMHRVKTDDNDRPLEDIRILSAKVLE